eukprot:6732993-Prorocentrum_lima.AAC.1
MGNRTNQVALPKPMMQDQRSGPDQSRAELDAEFYVEQRRQLIPPEQAEDQVEIYNIVQGWSMTKKAQ